MWLQPEVLVHCPRCRKRATILLNEQAVKGLSCLACGTQQRDVPARREYERRAVDPWFGYDLWLSVPFRGHSLWAYNARHCARLREFVVATQRERGSTPACPGGDRIDSMSMIEKLPAWMKAAKNREALVILLDELMVKAESAGG
jgi:hypothetical protein